MPPHQHSLSHSSLANASIEHNSGARGMTSTQGGRGVTRAATPTPSAGARAIKKGLCHSTSATAATERNCDARGSRSTRGGGEPPAPQRQCHLLARGPSKKPLPKLLSDSRNRMQSRRQGNKGCRGGPRGHPRRNAETIRRHAGHQHRLCHFSSATATTERNHGARGTTSAGGEGGQGAA